MQDSVQMKNVESPSTLHSPISWGMQNAKAPQSDIGFMIQILTFTTSFENFKKKGRRKGKKK